MGHCIPVNFIVPYELFQKILSDYPKANEINQFRLGFRSFLFIIIHNFVVVFFFNVLLQIENVQHMYVYMERPNVGCVVADIHICLIHFSKCHRAPHERRYFFTNTNSCINILYIASKIYKKGTIYKAH